MRRAPLEAPKPYADILCLGDSRIKLGILPRVMEDRLGVSAYNLANIGRAGSQQLFPVCDSVLERGLRPRAVLVDFSENLLCLSPGQNAACLGRLDWTTRQPRRRLAFARIPPWRSRRHFTCSCRVGATGATEVCCSRFGARGRGAIHSADDPRVFERNWRLNRGAQVAPREFVPVDDPTDGGWWNLASASGKRVLCRSAAGHGRGRQISVYWVLPPSIPMRRERLEQNGRDASYRQFVAERLARFSCLTVLDGERLIGSLDAFRDPLHVNRDGAVRLSLAVAAATAPRLRGERSEPRWIDLGEIDVHEASKYQNLVEDLDQSRAALEPILVGQSSREARTW